LVSEPSSDTIILGCLSLLYKIALVMHVTGAHALYT
jgi:hypothetical protein